MRQFVQAHTVFTCDICGKKDQEPGDRPALCYIVVSEFNSVETQKLPLLHLTFCRGCFMPARNAVKGAISKLAKEQDQCSQ